MVRYISPVSNEKMIALGSFLGSATLSLLAIPQKIALGIDPFELKGFVVPVFFGALAGGVLGFILARNRRLVLENLESHAELQKAHDELERRVEERTNEVKLNEARFRAIAEASPNIIVITRVSDGKIAYANPATHTVSGYHPDDIIGEVAPDFYVNQDDRASYIDVLKENGEANGYEVLLKKKDGTPFMVRANSRIVTLEGAPHIVGELEDITEYKLAEQALQESEAKFRAIAESAPVAVAISDLSDGTYLYCNDKVSEMLGLPPGAAVGRKASDFFVEPDQREALVQKIHDAGELRASEIKLKQEDGALVWGIGSARPVSFEGRPASLSVVMDITERKLAEKDLSETHDHIQKVLEASPTGFAISHPENGAIEYANNQLATMMRIPIEQFIGLPASHFYDNPDDRKEVIKQVQRGGSVTNNQILFRREDGSTFWGLMTIKPTVYQGESRFFTWIHDVTDLKKAMEEAEFANRAKSEFLANMSHELRTPLNAVIGFSDTMKEATFGPLNEKYLEYANDINSSGKHLLELVNDILDLAKLENETVELHIEKVPPKKIIGEIIPFISEMMNDQNIEFVDLCDGHENVEVLADRTKLKQVLLNLFTNAIKYNTEGGKVFLSCEGVADRMTRITVEDTGLGIPLSSQPHLFEAFNRLGYDDTNIKGTGIGLTISKHLMEGMDGRIDFESTEGQGSKFWVEIPWAV